MRQDTRIYVAGHRGLIGSAVVRALARAGHTQVITADHAALELRDAAAVNAFFTAQRPEVVVLAAGRVGGIVENQKVPADFITDNLLVQLNVVRAAQQHGVARFILFGSSCMYPRECPQPMAESALYSGLPEPTSMAYAVSKMAGVQLCLAHNQQHGQARFIPLIPNSAFGPNDNFDPASGHVLSALIRRFHEAQVTGAESVTLWGSGTPRREFIHADDIAEACLHLLSHDTLGLSFPLNVGSGSDVSIQELAQAVAAVVGYRGQLVWDRSKPDGAPRKLLDSARIRATGWAPRITLEEGLRSTYQWYLDHQVGTGVTP